jgi:DNA-binding NarL/FixJ family response regulator
MTQPIKILIVDDDPDVLFATTRLVKKAGYTVMEASTGEAAIKTAREQKPDIILLDVVLPDIMGTEICRQIKSDPVFDGTFVILTSGMRTSSDQQSDGLDAGADGYITRPVSNRELIARVNAMVRILMGERDRLHKKITKKNIALDVLLEKREQDKKKVADAIMKNLDKTVLPYIDRIKHCNRRQDAVELASIIEANIKKSVCPFTSSFSAVYMTLTPTEIQVADFIKAGKTSKEIADILNISARSVNFHRNNIRRKLHIHGSKINLRTFLLSIS